jgi:SAM-dependent methyltransferase
MEKITDHTTWGINDWNFFFTEKGTRWRDKDYQYLNNLFDLSVLANSLLDVGCALGDGLIYLKHKCHKVNMFAGTDVSHQAVESCTKNPELHQMEFFQHDILNPFPKRYDNIICLQTLEHIENPQKAIRNLIDATKALLIIAVPYRNRRPDKNHLWSFDENDFSELVDLYCIDRRKRNIYWLIDKQKKGISFRKKHAQYLRELFNKLCKAVYY